MKIKGNEAVKINEMLKEALQWGNRYVSLDTIGAGGYFQADSMQYFSTKSGVQQHNYLRHAIDGQYREALPILSLQERLQRKIELEQISRSPGSEPKDIAIDTGIIHYQERARTEVFTEEIIRQLQAYNVKPDAGQLQEHISRDDQQFIIEGVHLELGGERFYKIHIAQNEQRAFVVGDIEPQQTIRQQTNVPIMFELSDGSLLNENAREIRNMMRKELENGNRFMSFPVDKGILEKEDFSFFKSSFDALQYAYENSTDRDRYVVRSTSAVEKELTRLIDRPERATDNERQEKTKSNEREAKPPRNNDRSR